jgi:hypothetical protein
MTAEDRTGIVSSRVTPESVERDAKDRAADVVVAWRRLDWDAIAGADEQALLALREAAEAHESARRFLQDEAGEVGGRLDEGLVRFYASEVAPLLGPAVLARLARPAEEQRDDEGLVPRGRPSVTVGHTVRMNTGCGNLYVTVNESDDGRPFELFNHMGKAGGCAASQNEAIGRLISYAMRCGASVEPLIKQLKGISCHRPAWGEDGKISSCSDAIGKALEKYYIAKSANASEAGAALDPPLEGERRRMAEVMTSSGGNGRRLADVTGVQGACPDCGSQLAFEEGCVKCHSCGFTECG